MAGAAERQRAYFPVERRRGQRAEQVADEVKRSDQPGGSHAELQVAREGREHDPIGDACDADVQADREHAMASRTNEELRTPASTAVMVRVPLK